MEFHIQFQKLLKFHGLNHFENQAKTTIDADKIHNHFLKGIAFLKIIQFGKMSESGLINIKIVTEYQLISHNNHQYCGLNKTSSIDADAK